MIEAIIFDVDGTLYDETHAKVKAEVLTAQFISDNSDYSRDEVFHHFRKAKTQVIKDYSGCTIRNDRTKWYESTLELLGISNISPVEANDFYWSVVFQNIEPYLDLDAVIKELAKKYKLYILTDEFLNLQFKKLEILGLKDYFCEVVSSEKVGKTKPNKELFEYMLNIIGKPRQNIVMIGDNPKADIAGANSVGIHSVWLRRGKYHYYYYPDGNKPEITINNYLELQKKLDEI